MQRRHFLTTSAAAVSALTAPAVWSQSTPRLTPIKFTLDFRITGQTSPFFLAQQRGYYKDEGLDVSIDVGSGSVASITRIASGVYQMGLGDISSLVEFQASQSGCALPHHLNSTTSVSMINARCTGNPSPAIPPYPSATTQPSNNATFNDGTRWVSHSQRRRKK